MAIDPGQNNLGTSSSMDEDMAAMFVPNDEALYEYFANPDSAGHFLLARFAPSVEVNGIESLLSALDSVPQKNIAPFLKNLMKSSFAKTVLSKFDKITDDANELMNIRGEHVDECVIANNGVIYILNSVFGPGAYQAVSAPTLVFDNMGVMRNVISQLRYDYYLLAMDANYTFIIPDDNYFVYFDPLTKTSSKPKVYSFHYNTKKPKANGALKFWADVYKFNPETYEVVDTLTEEEYNVSGTQFGDVSSFAANRMTDLLEYFIIVHDDENGIYTGNKYFQTKGYATIKVDATDPENIKLYGGEQLERGTSIAISSINKQKNGTTYCTVPGELDAEGLHTAIPTPPTRSVFENMQLQSEEFERFNKFFHLCYPGEDYASKTDAGLLKKVFEIKNNNALLDSALRYSIFYTNTEDTKAYTKNTIPFFNIFHYTVYAPSNEAIEYVYGLGLPTWEQVQAVADAGNNKKAASMLRSILSFAKYHFQDNSVYVDNAPIKAIDPTTGMTVYTKKFTTAVINEKTNRFYELELSSEGNTVAVKDNLGNVRKVLVDGVENKDWNIMCRDNVYTSSGTGPSADLKNYSSSSYTVLQPIDGALLNESMFGYDGRFRRFANNGCVVDTMYVDATGAVNVNGRNYYLVAKLGNIKLANTEGIQEIHKAGYLMKTMTESQAKEEWAYTREELITERVSVNGKWEYHPILVTDEGFAVNEVKDNKGVTISYEYKTIEEDGIIYKVKLNNDGSIKPDGKIEIGVVEPEEGGNNN